MIRRVCLLALFTLAGCKNGGSAAAGGTIVLQLESTTPVETVQLRVFDPKGNMSQFTFDTKGRDLTKDKAIGEITPGSLITSGKILIVGEGYLAPASTPVGSGRAEATFVVGQLQTVTLTLKADLVDQDMDGYAKQEDCDDQNSKRNPFFTDVCADNLDNDCDGTADNGCPCNAGDTRACYNDADGSTRNMGDCKDGMQACTAGAWGLCQGSVGPVAETCNGRDDNCNGTVDESCPCTPSTQRACNGRKVSSTTGSAADLMLVGECKAGEQQCVGSAWGDCVGATLPVDETCNGKDDDCDGTFDDGFDADGDGFTTCGTVNGVCARPPVGGTASDLIDCDDADATRHPCQADKCGDGNVDDDCSGAGNECTVAAGTCADAGYYAGWQAAGGRARAECRREGSTYGTECDPTTLLCKTPAAQCTQLPAAIGTLVAAMRDVCKEVTGCDAGTTNAPGLGAALVNTDPYGDCGTFSCSGVPVGQVIYAGRVANTDTGWRVNGQAFECHSLPDVAAALTRCASGACETVVSACQRTYPSGVSGNVVMLSSAAACQVPQGFVSLANLGTTCVTPTGSTTSSGPVLSSVANTKTDPLGRCPTQISDCLNVSPTGWVAGPTNSSCFEDASPSAGQFLCNGSGACGTTVDATTCTSGLAQHLCNNKCRNDSSCVAGAVATAPYCHNLADGDKFTANCPANQVCDGVALVDNATVTCKECSFDAACGVGCLTCTGGSICGKGISGGAVVPAGANAATGSACMCGIVDVNSVGIPCGDHCCGAGQACIAGACAAMGPTNNLPPCAPGATTGAATCTAGQYCDTSAWPFKCAAPSLGGPACNQSQCTATQGCGDFNASTCTTCNTNSSCGTPAIDCSATGFGSGPAGAPTGRTCTTATTCSASECTGTCAGGAVGNGQACVLGASGPTGPTSECTGDGACGPACATCTGGTHCLCTGAPGKSCHCG